MSVDTNHFTAPRPRFASADAAHWIPAAPPVNVISFDIEEYFQVSNFAHLVAFDEWPNYESHVERNTDLILETLDEARTRGTFFVLGWVAERYPALIRRVAAQGHEIATHGYRHRLIYDLDPQEFRSDLKRSIEAIEQAAGQKVLGHRAPSFSITHRSMWALDIMQELGLKYDSSIFPVRHPRYGIVNSPRAPYEIRPGFWEFPIATTRLAGTNMPIGGGPYFRLYPYWVTRHGLRRINKEGLPAMVYLHPWELDPEQPRLPASLQARVRHYTNLKKTRSRLQQLCRDFHFTTARAALSLPA